MQLAVEMSSKRSIVTRQKGGDKVNRRRKPPKVVARGFAAIERRRRALGLSCRKLATAAGLSARAYARLKAGVTATMRKRTRAALHAALDAAPRAAPADTFVALHRGAMTLFARELGADPETVLATDFSKQTSVNPAWLMAARIRRLAMCVLADELDIPKARIAHAIGVTKQNVGQAVTQISDLRDRDPKIEAAIVRVARLLGRQA
jgi:transcriptional regulator with XRE-family HTH domain